MSSGRWYGDGCGLPKENNRLGEEQVQAVRK